MNDQVDETVVEEETAVETSEEVIEEQEVEENQEVDSEEEEATIEYVDVEYEGKQYKVPEELKDALMLQSDYTRKRQADVQKFAEFEQQKQQFEQSVQAQQQHLQLHVQVAALDSQIEQYKNVDWGKLSEDDPIQAQQAFMQYQQLKDARHGMVEHIRQQEQETTLKRQAELATQREQGLETLAREIPGWSDNLRKDLAEHGQVYGYSAEEMGQVIDPRAVKVLHDAYLYRKSLKKATTSPKPELKPVKPIKGKSTGKKDPSKMSTDEWIRERNKEVARKQH